MFWDFVNDNIRSDTAVLRLKWHGKDPGFDVEQAITQIECRQRYGKKLSETLGRAPHFLFPSVLAGEQATSDLMARYHASLVGDVASVADLTAGLGIDAWHMAAAHPGAPVAALELSQQRANALAANAKLLDVPNLEVVHADCAHLPPADAYFIDPARRAADGARVFSLADCQPDILQLLPKIKSRLIVKASPMLDISMAVSQLADAGANVSKAIALGTSSECRELVFVCQPQSDSAPTLISSVTLAGEQQLSYSFTLSDAANADPGPGLSSKDIVAGQKVLVPYPAVMKAAPFRLIPSVTGTRAIAPNTHLFVGDHPAPTPFGQWYDIIDVVPYESRYIKRFSRTYPTIQVSTRNFDVPAEALRRKLGVRDTGPLRLFAVTAADSRPLMIVTRPEAAL